MGQRLGLAAALLGDPATLILDEPVNGLDPEGVKWVRTLAQQWAREGRTVFISSHLMSEMAQTADQLVVIGRGRIIASGPLEAVVSAATQATVRVVSPRAARLAEVLVREGAQIVSHEDHLEVAALSSAAVGDLAAAHGISLHELTPQTASLEEAFLSLTRDDVEYRSAAALEQGPTR